MLIKSTALLASLFGLASADFYLFTATEFSVDDSGATQRADGYYFFTSPPDCEDITNYGIFQTAWDDVSGDRTGGVRCSGCGDDNPTELEWNNDMGHFTWYAARDNNLVDLDDNIVGNCIIDRSQDYTCPVPPLALPSTGRRLLFCTSSMNADAIND